MPLEMKYFVLKPCGHGPHNKAARMALVAYAKAIAGHDKELSSALLDWSARAEVEALDAPGSGDEMRKALVGIVPMCDDIKARAKAALAAALKER